MTYDSTDDTLRHIRQLQNELNYVVMDLCERAGHHDHSKLLSPEKELFDRVTPRLKTLSYGSDEYNAMLEELKPGLAHHYANNSHHPEFYANGVNDMSLMDIIEMLCDWRAAGMRHANGNMRASLDINRKRFSIDDQLFGIMENTARELGWIA